jgi:flagellar basal body-associated protein FliL
VKFTFISKTKLPRILYNALLIIAGALIGILVIGTIFGAARSSDAKPVLRLGKPDENRTAQPLTDDIRIYSGLGRLRIPLSNSSILILSIAFPYLHSDTAFTEELAAKTGDFKTIAADYFSSLEADKIIQLDEDAAKTEILKRYNENLRLGSIETLYFSDMMILDL